MKKLCIVFIFSVSLMALSLKNNSYVLQERNIYICTIPEIWNSISNYGSFGGEYYGLTWPGDSTFNNYYLWNSYFVVGCKVNDSAYVTAHNYPSGEWDPVQTDPLYQGPGRSEWDILTAYHDFVSNPYNSSGRHTGIYVKVRALHWSYEYWNDFIAYEMYITFNRDSSDIPGVGNQLDSVFIGMWYDCDVSGADPSDPHIDDWVWFDGYVNHEWDTLGYPFDSVTILSDTFLNIPDGIYDQYQVFGDDTMEHTVDGDTLIIPRNTSFMWDGDDPSTPGNDTGENGASAGFVGLRLIYSPPSPADTVWVNAYGDTCRIPRVWAHQCLENDPANDAELFNYLAGHHPATGYHRFVYRPQDVDDYRWLLSSGPFTISDGETLKFVFAVSVGQGMNGGYDSVYYNSWKRGLRQRLDFALSAYYYGSQISDPQHPSDPEEDIHWGGYQISERNSYKKIKIFKTSGNIVSKFLKLSFYIPVKELSIFDVSGKSVKKFNFNQAKYSFTLDLTPYPQGIYFIKAISQKNLNYLEVKKIIYVR